MSTDDIAPCRYMRLSMYPDGDDYARYYYTRVYVPSQIDLAGIVEQAQRLNGDVS